MLIERGAGEEKLPLEEFTVQEIIKALGGDSSGPRDFERKRTFLQTQFDFRTKPLHAEIARLKEELKDKDKAIEEL